MSKTPATQCDPAAFAALKQPAVEALARILYFERSTTTRKTRAACADWLVRQRRQIATLQEVSIRRQGTLSLMADVFIRGEFAKPHEVMQADSTTELCTHHRELNPCVLSALMALVMEESTRHVDHVREYLEDRARRKRQLGKSNEEEEGDDAAVALWLRNIARLSVLWMGKSRWEDTTRRPLGLSVPRCARDLACTACKLAVVGGSMEFLRDLRTSLLVRHAHAGAGRRDNASAAAPPPLLLRMVEAWIGACYTLRKRRDMWSESDRIAGLVVKLRAEMSGGSGAKGQGRGGRWQLPEARRRYTRGGWPRPPMEADVEEYMRASESDGDDGNGYVVEDDENVAGRRRRRQRTAQREGYSPHLPEKLSVRPGDGGNTTARRATMCFDNTPADTSSSASPPRVHTNHDDPPARAKPLPPLPRPRSGARVDGAGASPVSSSDSAGEPWNADYERYILRGSRYMDPPEAHLSATDDAHHDTDTTAASVLRTPSSIFTRSAPPSASPSSSPSEYSPTEDDTAPAKRWEEAGSSAGDRESPRGRRPRSGIPVPLRRGYERLPVPAAVAAAREGSAYSVSSSVLLGYGGERRRCGSSG